MGIRPSMQKVMHKFVLAELGLDYSVLELGDQFAGTKTGRVLARQFYEKLGCKRYVCIDGNGLNGALALDLNKPIVGTNGSADVQPKTFDVVTDFGTGEHIWDQSQVWRTMHELLRKGGYLVFDRPYQGYGGHCFYLTQPAAIAAFVHANSYECLWFGRALTTRGELVRGVLRKMKDMPFIVPQQGRYHKHLMLENTPTPDHKNSNLRELGVVGKKPFAVADERTDKGIFDWEPDELANGAEAP